MRALYRAACVCCVVLASSAQARLPLSPGTWRIADAPAELREAVSRADLIVVSIHDELLQELRRQLAEGGPALAIRSCHIDVTGVAQRIARRTGIVAGRTSDRLRNPANAPKPWAAPLVKTNAGRLAREVDGFAVDLGNAVGVLRPIAERPICASCHGPVEKMSSDVRRLLGDSYPGDRAVGFKDGEIRGWYWVEVPKTR